MKRLLTTLVILTGLIGSAGAVWADAKSDYNKGKVASAAGDYAEAVKWYRKAAERGGMRGRSTILALDTTSASASLRIMLKR